MRIGLHLQSRIELTRRVVDGVLKYASQHRQLSLHDFLYAGDEPVLSERPPWADKVDGVILKVGRVAGIRPWLRRARVPVVNTTSALHDDWAIASVFTDPHSFARLAAEHFLALGLRRFVFVGCRSDGRSRGMCRALADVLAAHQLRVHGCFAKQPFSGTYEELAAFDEVKGKLARLIQSAKGPLALMAVNDRCAATVCRLVQQLGKAIPDDVAVLGINDTDVARFNIPPISSLRPPHEQIGYEAARLVHGLARGKHLAERTVMVPNVELVARESTIGKQRAHSTDELRALDYIRQKACEGIRVEDVAAYVRMPLRTFELGFASALGRTVGEEIRRVQLARVKSLLETTDLSLSAVARQVSLADASSLVKFFHRLTGMSPGKYRRRKRAALRAAADE